MQLNHTHVLAAGITAAALAGTLLHSGVQAQQRVAGPIGISGRAQLGSVVCALDVTPGANYLKQWCVVTNSTYWSPGQFNLIGAQDPMSTGTGFLPLTDLFYVYAYGSSLPGVTVNRAVSSQKYGGPWLYVP